MIKTSKLLINVGIAINKLSERPCLTLPMESDRNFELILSWKRARIATLFRDVYPSIS